MMQMTPTKFISLNDPATLFCIGWAAAMLALIFPVPPVWDTFIHPWRIEFVVSLSLSLFLIAGFFLFRDRITLPVLSSDEIKFVVLPMSAFIVWSALSALWAVSWRSAVHHTLLWSVYLVFFISVRRLLEAGRTYRPLFSLLTVFLAFFGVFALAGYLTYLSIGGATNNGIVFSKFGEQVNAVFPFVLLAVIRFRSKRFAVGVVILALLWLLILCGLGRMNLLIFAASLAITAAVVFAVPRMRMYRRRFCVAAFVLLIVPAVLFSLPAASAGDGVSTASRLSGNSVTQGSNSFRVLMAKLSLEMLKAHPMAGVGADNFGFETNRFRARYGQANPDDPDLAQAESNIPERAHNEFLQIAAELGIVGILIFSWFLFGISVMAYRAFRLPKFSPYRFAALLGIAAFLASGLVTSYSFRIVQNGLVFFLLLAVCSKYYLAETGRSVKPDPAHRRALTPGFAFALSSCLLLLAFNTVRVSSVIIAQQSNYDPDMSAASRSYETAIRIDPENAYALRDHGLRLFNDGDYAAASDRLSAAIALGLATSADFSYLASAQSLAGDDIAAETTMARAAEMYPRSPFVLTRYAVLLKNNGKAAEAERQFGRAYSLDPAAANTWMTLITRGPRAASDLAFKQKDHAAIMDLRPAESIYAVVSERDIRFPDERIKLPFEQLSKLKP